MSIVQSADYYESNGHHVTYLLKYDIHEIVNEKILVGQWFTLMPSFNCEKKTAHENHILHFYIVFL